MPNNFRLAKVSSLLKKEITLILQNDLENDFIRDHFVNISKIDLSGDLQICKIYITSTAKETVRKEIVSNLNTAKSFIRHNLGKRIEMRRVPEIIFKDDIVLEKGLSVLKILDEIKNTNQKKNNKVEDQDANS
jgi:ribosome-binding factor A